MYQEPTRRLPNLSERCHVRKIARLLAQPLSPVGSPIFGVTKSSKRASAMSATHTTHSDQANHAAVRLLIGLISRPCSLAPSSQHHLTALPSPERYDKRYEEHLRKRVESNFEESLT